MEMEEYKYNDKMLGGGRTPHLWFVKPDGKAVRFEGRTIPGVAVVATQKYEKNGKWSGSLWGLTLAEGVTPIRLVADLHRKFCDPWGSWEDLARHYGVSVGAIRTAISAEYPNGAARLDRVAADLAALAAPAHATWLGNAFSLLMLPPTGGTVKVEKIEMSDVPSSAVSCVGHADTARVFAGVLGREVEVNRVSISLAHGDILFVGQYTGPRLSEGVKELPEGAVITWWKVTI
jgi:hypothetical protein